MASSHPLFLLRWTLVNLGIGSLGFKYFQQGFQVSKKEAEGLKWRIRWDPKVNLSSRQGNGWKFIEPQLPSGQKEYTFQGILCPVVAGGNMVKFNNSLSP